MAEQEIDEALYKDFAKRADQDNRIGKQVFQVSEVVTDTWPSGDPRTKIKGTLRGHGSKVQIEGLPLPSNEEMKREAALLKQGKSTWSAGKHAGVGRTAGMVLNLWKLYQKKVETLQPGDEFGVQVVKNKEGFLRVVQVIPMPGETTSSSDVPF